MKYTISVCLDEWEITANSEKEVLEKVAGMLADGAYSVEIVVTEVELE